MVDHWSNNFSTASQDSRRCSGCPPEVVVPSCGIPSIIQSDNGREFVNKLIEEVVATWPGQVQLVSGRPRHPQSQGLVEQAHYTLERMISAKIAESGAEHPPWADWLPHITCKTDSACMHTLYIHVYTMSFCRHPQHSSTRDNEADSV